MPLVAHCELPTFALLRHDGINVVKRADQQPRLNIGLLNLMPDAVLAATERQWMRLCSSFEDAVLYVYPFTFNPGERSESAQAHIARYYDTLATIERRRLDLLIVTGANPKTSDITSETFWQPMIDTITWARQQGCPVVCSCLATHAVAKAFFGIDRIRLPRKCWGVYPHSLLDPHHPLVQNVDAGWHGPHSHVYGVTRQQLDDVGIRVLIDSVDAGVYVAVSQNALEFVFLQGHPEYDANSLLKEFKREVQRFVDDGIPEFPHLPENCFGDDAIEIIAQFRDALIVAKSKGNPLPDFPEQRLEANLRNLWRTTGHQIFDNLFREVLHAG